jgi:hypothetical protein
MENIETNTTTETLDTAHRGRRSTLAPEIIQGITDRLAKGETVKAVALALNVPATTVNYYKNRANKAANASSKAAGSASGAEGRLLASYDSKITKLTAEIETAKQELRDLVTKRNGLARVLEVEADSDVV